MQCLLNCLGDWAGFGGNAGELIHSCPGICCGWSRVCVRCWGRVQEGDWDWSLGVVFEENRLGLKISKGMDFLF
ncbi:hypothetical protein M6B38_120250 [Iris pallida]|uniref:Uncharacterized protein n=1 Tax=Iris pallida TaxID=29817 RepID=A0AAX6HA51_IRIPA|nr:hypothetical protein M6B38_120250 [Iris pallida]